MVDTTSNPYETNPYETDQVGGMDLEARNMHAALQERMFGIESEGVRLGRFVVLERLGSGGMGVVYAAYDPTLDRKIAVKLVHRHVADALGEEVLLNEAQALARLAHPHVVTVHDVGSIEDRIFIAMEFVDGEPLSRWDVAEQGWRATLEVYLEAGEGLAAAHRAGVVHGDFKPDNVLVDRDGRVRVVDFGLARRSGPTTPESRSDGSGTPSTPSPRAGTPQYMAPEQVRGEGADARSDQFSFCVALSEALYGEHPFGEGSRAERAEAIASGPQRSAMQHPDVPSHVQRALQRGLRADRQERFADMDALLDALRPRARASRRRTVAVGLMLVLAAGLGYLVAGRATGEAPCTRAGDRLLGVWDDEVRAEVEVAFEATQLRFASHAAREVSTVLDGYARSWALVHRDVCLATAVDHEQTVAELDVRMRCLDRRLSELEGLSAVLREADVRAVPKALEAANGLEAPRSCATMVVEEADRALTDEQRALVAQLDEVRGRARALQATGRLDRAAVETREALALARRLGDERGIAELQYLEGARHMLRDDATAALPVLLETLVGAEHSGDDELRGLALGQMAMVLTSFERFDEALRYLVLARAALERADASAARRLNLELSLGFVHTRSGNYEEATRVLTEAVERAQSLADDRAGELLLAIAYNNLGIVQRDRGENEAALASMQRALRIRTTRYGPTHPEVAMMRYNIGTVLLQEGRWQDAREHLRAALAVHEELGGAEGLDVGYDLRAIGACELELGRYDQSLAMFDRAARIFERAGEAAQVELAFVLLERGQLLRNLDRAREALALDQRAATLLEERVGSQHVDLSFALVGIGEDWIDLDQPERALEPFRRALELREGRGMLVEAVAEARFGVARALAGTEPERARALAEQALEELGEVSPSRASQMRSFLDGLVAE